MCLVISWLSISTARAAKQPLESYSKRAEIHSGRLDMRECSTKRDRGRLFIVQRIQPSCSRVRRVDQEKSGVSPLPGEPPDLWTRSPKLWQEAVASLHHRGGLRARDVALFSRESQT